MQVRIVAFEFWTFSEATPSGVENRAARSFSEETEVRKYQKKQKVLALAYSLTTVNIFFWPAGDPTSKSEFLTSPRSVTIQPSALLPKPRPAPSPYPKPTNCDKLQWLLHFAGFCLLPHASPFDLLTFHPALLHSNRASSSVRHCLWVCVLFHRQHRSWHQAHHPTNSSFNLTFWQNNLIAGIGHRLLAVL